MENEAVQQKMPVGIKLTLIYIGIEILYSLGQIISLLIKLNLSSTSDLTYAASQLVFIAIPGILFYGIFKRFKWARIAAISWYIVGLIYLAFLLFSLEFTEVFRVWDMPVAIRSIIHYITGAWFATLLVVIYLTVKRDFFAK